MSIKRQHRQLDLQLIKLKKQKLLQSEHLIRNQKTQRVVQVIKATQERITQVVVVHHIALIAETDHLQKQVAQEVRPVGAQAADQEENRNEVSNEKLFNKNDIRNSIHWDAEWTNCMGCDAHY